jgi:hypothetical protein
VGGWLQAGGDITSPKWNVTQLVFCRPVACTNKGLGPLPLTSESFSTGGGTLLIFVSGSAFATTTNTRPCIGVTLDGDSATTRSFCIYANNAFEHLPILTFPYILKNIGAGNHTIRIEAFSPAVMETNVDDTFAVTVEELPF